MTLAAITSLAVCALGVEAREVKLLVSFVVALLLIGVVGLWGANGAQNRCRKHMSYYQSVTESSIGCKCAIYLEKLRIDRADK
jgi:hypothetical protein